MKIKKLIPLMLIVILLAGCGNKESTVEEKPLENTEVAAEENEEVKETKEAEEVQEEKVEEKTESSIGNVDESELGRLEVINEKKNINDVIESGPIKLTVKDIQMSKLNPSESYKPMFDEKNEVTVLVMELEVENTSDETISFYPDQGTVVTNTKEQKDADMFLSDSVGGDFIGQVIKSGDVIFLLDSKAEEVNSMKFVLGHPSNESFESVGEDVVLEYEYVLTK